jgi:hypothetical protein
MSGALIVLAEGELCRLCGRKGTHECILAPARSLREKESDEVNLAEINSVRRELRDLSDQVSAIQKHWGAHHIVDTQTTYTCRCGRVFFDLRSFNRHVEDEPL